MNGDHREPAARNLSEFFQSVANSAAEATIHLSDGDERAYFLASLDRLDWKQDDERWMVGLDLLDFDREWSRRDDPLSRELLALLVRITADSRTMIEEAPNPAGTNHTQETARRLRAATDRLHVIVHALTAVHTLGSAES
jgi:hypothetical protein